MRALRLLSKPARWGCNLCSFVFRVVVVFLVILLATIFTNYWLGRAAAQLVYLVFNAFYSVFVKEPMVPNDPTELYIDAQGNYYLRSYRSP